MLKNILFIVLLGVISLDVYAEEIKECLTLRNAYGPYDYTNKSDVKSKLPIVELAHFNENVASLRGGARINNQATLIADLDYTLRAFPNHHRALYAVSRFRLKTPLTYNGKYASATCYFDRALKFKHDDGTVHMLYGIYNHKKKLYKKAEENYKNAELYLKKSAQLQYNFGLLLFDMKKYKQSYRHAKIAYELGYPLPGLQRKLKKIKQWK